MGSVSPVGKLRNKITIERHNFGNDTYGGYTTTTQTTVITAFAQIKPKTAKQVFNESTGERIQNPQEFEFLIRYRTGLSTAMRVKFGTRLFDIKSIENDNEYDRYMKIIATENVGT